MTAELRSVLIGTAGLSAAAVAALLLTFARARITTSISKRQRTARVAGVAVALQLVHFLEELATGFHQRFPEQLGLTAWSSSFFVSFNLFWLAVWILSCRVLAAGHLTAVAALWFLGIAGVANGIAHPLLSLGTGSYFPGLMTSPFVGAACLLLLRRLAVITAGSSTAGRSL